jgi:cytochrome c5
MDFSIHALTDMRVRMFVNSPKRLKTLALAFIRALLYIFQRGDTPMLGKTGLLIFITTALAAVTFAAVQQLPDGDGKKLIEDRCTSCHDSSLITNLKQNQDDWKKLIDRMVGFGAQMDDKEKGTASEYLAKFFGPAGAGGANAGGNAGDDKAAQGLVEGICASCHDSGLVKSTQATKQQWSEIVERMNGKGAGLSAKDTATLVDYLAKTYAAK